MTTTTPHALVADLFRRFAIYAAGGDPVRHKTSYLALPWTAQLYVVGGHRRRQLRLRVRSFPRRSPIPDSSCHWRSSLLRDLDVEGHLPLSLDPAARRSRCPTRPT